MTWRLSLHPFALLAVLAHHGKGTGNARLSHQDEWVAGRVVQGGTAPSWTIRLLFSMVLPCNTCLTVMRERLNEVWRRRPHVHLNLSTFFCRSHSIGFFSFAVAFRRLSHFPCLYLQLSFGGFFTRVQVAAVSTWAVSTMPPCHLGQR